MKRSTFSSLLLGILAAASLVVRADVLIVADEFPAMEIVAAKLKSEEHIASKVIAQDALPSSLTPFEAVIVYIHRDLAEKAELAFIEYAKAGGKLVLLHHSISSGKRKNKQWFPFLGVSLPLGEVNQGGYKWTEGVTLDLVSLNQSHFIMTNRVTYPASIPFNSTNTPARGTALPGFTLKESEVYLNHVFTEPRTLLMGVRYTDATNSVTYMQEHAGWVKPAGKGWIVYLMPGHTAHDFEDPAYARIVLNAVVFKP